MNWLRLLLFTHLVATDDPLHFRRMQSISTLTLTVSLAICVAVWLTAYEITAISLFSFQCASFQGIYHWPFNWTDLLELCQNSATWSDKSWLNVNSSRIRLLHSKPIGQHILAVNSVPYTLLIMIGVNIAFHLIFWFIHKSHHWVKSNPKWQKKVVHYLIWSMDAILVVNIVSLIGLCDHQWNAQFMTYIFRVCKRLANGFSIEQAFGSFFSLQSTCTAVHLANNGFERESLVTECTYRLNITFCIVFACLWIYFAFHLLVAMYSCLFKIALFALPSLRMCLIYSVLQCKTFQPSIPFYQMVVILQTNIFENKHAAIEKARELLGEDSVKTKNQLGQTAVKEVDEGSIVESLETLETRVPLIETAV